MFPQVITEHDLVAANCSCVDADHQPASVFETAQAMANVSVPDDGSRCSCSGPLFTDVLRQRYQTTAALLKKLQQVWRVRQVFQYSSNPNHLVLRWDAVQRIDPMDDAFTFTIKALMRKLCELGHSDKCRGGRARVAHTRGSEGGTEALEGPM